MARLQVLICTIGAQGIERVATGRYPQVEGVEYLVSWQLPDEDIPVPDSIAIRDDFKICKTDSRGVCRNRNNAIACATAPLCLVSDDDVEFAKEELQSLIGAFKQYSEDDILTVKYRSKDYPKPYPDTTFVISKAPKGYYVSCIEIAFRLDSVRGKVRFNENISLGTPVLRCGEEDVFMYDARKTGLKARFVPIYVGTHNHASTASREHDEPYFWMTKGAVMRYIHSKTWFARICVNAWRASRRSDKGILYYIRHALKGVKYASDNKVFAKV